MAQHLQSGTTVGPSCVSLRALLSSCSLVDTRQPSTVCSVGSGCRVGVLGGCRTAVAALEPLSRSLLLLQAGAERCHVFCTKEVAALARSYGPERMLVHPCLVSESQQPDQGAPFSKLRPVLSVLQKAVQEAVQAIQSTIEECDILVIGPELSRSIASDATIRQVIKVLREGERTSGCLGKPVIIDGEGVEVVITFPHFVKGYQAAILTPTWEQLLQLARALQLQSESANARQELPAAVANALGVATVICKGTQGGPEEGESADISTDVLMAGTMAAMLSWSALQNEATNPALPHASQACPEWAASAAGRVLQLARKRACAKHEHEVVAGDVSQELGPALREYMAEHLE